MKKITIDKCLNCPYREQDGRIISNTYHQVCSYKNNKTYRPTIEDINSIPKWCKLEDE